MAVVGIEKVYLAILDENDNPVLDDTKGFKTGLIEITDQMLGTSTVNFTVSKNGEELDGNNKEVGYIKSMPTAQMDVTFNDLPFDIQNKMLGRIKTGAGWVDSLTNSYVVVIAKSPTPDFKNYVYYCLGKSVPTPKGKNMQTNTSKKVNRVSDDFTFEGLTCDRTNNMPYIVASDLDSGFSEKALFDQLVPGQTLVSSTSNTVSSATSAPSNASVSGTTH